VRDFAVANRAVIAPFERTDWIRNSEFRTRLGVYRSELREILARWPDLPGRHHLATIADCPNEVCNAIRIGGAGWTPSFDFTKAGAKFVHAELRRLAPRVKPP
jgi:hypothetical protein